MPTADLGSVTYDLMEVLQMSKYLDHFERLNFTSGASGLPTPSEGVRGHRVRGHSCPSFNGKDASYR